MSHNITHIVFAQDEEYDRARETPDPSFRHIFPFCIAFVRTVGEVRRALLFARERRLAIRIRSGRQHIQGWSTVDNGLIVDVSEMNQLRRTKRKLIAGAGATFRQLNAFLAHTGLALPFPDAQQIGLSGAALGGGFGLLSRRFGLLSDRVLALRIVTPEGRVLYCSNTQHADLFWACRGAGGGQFGVVTHFTLLLHRVPTNLRSFELCLPPSTAILDQWQRWQHRHLVGSTLELKDGAFAIRGLCSGYLPLPFAGRCKFRSVTWHDYYSRMNARRDPPFHRWLGWFVTRPLPAEAQQLLLNASVPRNASFWAILLHGCVARGPATAFAHRDALLYMEVGAEWWREQESGALRSFVAGLNDALRPFGSGAYVNIPNEGLLDWPQQYYGHNYVRLQQIKRRYDPANILRFQQSL